jgi:hypothetical protein
LLLQDLHGTVDRQAHGTHTPTTDHDIFILINDLPEFHFRVYVLKPGEKFHNLIVFAFE